MPQITRSIVTAFALVIVALLPRTSFADEWEIAPTDDSRVSFGKVSIVGGAVGTEPILFVLKNITLSTPVQVVLAATDARQPVEMAVYKETPSKPLLSGTATSEKSLTFRFRTGDQVYFAVNGADGAHYQLFTWVWPEIQVEDASPIVPVSEYPASPPRVTKSSPAATETSSTSNPPTGAAVVLGAWPSIFLGLILLALIAIIVLLWRRGSKKGAAVLLLSVFVQTSLAEEKGVPGRVTPAQEKPPIKRSVKEATDLVDKIEKAIKTASEDPGVHKPTKMDPGIEFAKDPYRDTTIPIKITKEATGKTGSEIKITKIVGDLAALTKVTLGLLEEFGFIDPREAAIQRNLNPPGMPLLPSRCAKDPECGPCVKKANKDLMDAQSLLETQYVIYKQTELAAGRIIELADAAAGLSPYAKLAWTVQKDSGEVSKAKEEFYSKYDTNLAKLLSNLNDALIAEGACERSAFGDQDWYNRYGLLYHTFMRERYTRK